MKYVLTKASDDEYLEIVDYNLEEINNLAFSQSIIIKDSSFFGVLDIGRYINKSDEFCKSLIQIPLEIMIYDDYIEEMLDN